MVDGDSKNPGGGTAGAGEGARGSGATGSKMALVHLLAMGHLARAAPRCIFLLLFFLHSIRKLFIIVLPSLW